MLGTTLIKRFEQFCPLELAENGDPVGLHIGSVDKEVKKVLITLDVRPDVVKEAIEKKIDLIIAKHPPLFVPAKRLTDDQVQTKMYNDLIRHNIAVYAAHTNMDIIENGLNDWFCDALGIKETTYLTKTHTISYRKIQVFVPKTHVNKVKEALVNAGGGTYDNYTGCTFQTNGIGTFTPVENAQPYVGKKNQESKVDEAKLEMIFPKNQQEELLKALFSSHPYEVPAFDIFENLALEKNYGIGRIGILEKTMSLKDFALHVKETFQLDGVKVIGKDLQKPVQKIAICGGSGQKFYWDALKKGADCYITGDVYYHTAHDFLEEKTACIDPGHYMEYYCKERLCAIFNEWKKENNWEVDFVVSETNTNPFTQL